MRTRRLVGETEDSPGHAIAGELNDKDATAFDVWELHVILMPIKGGRVRMETCYDNW
jgi:hypothetical protein